MCLAAPKKREKRRWCENYRHGIGKDVVGCCFLFCTTTQWTQRHTQPTRRIKTGEAFQWRSGVWEAEACTPTRVLLRYFLGLHSLILMNFVGNMMACKLSFLMTAVEYRLFAPRLCSGLVVRLLYVLPVVSRRMVRRVIRCPSKRGTNSLCCSCASSVCWSLYFPCAFSACWIGDVSTQYLISIRCISDVPWYDSQGAWICRAIC